MSSFLGFRTVMRPFSPLSNPTGRPDARPKQVENPVFETHAKGAGLTFKTFEVANRQDDFVIGGCLARVGRG